MSLDNDSITMKDSAPLSPLERGLGQAAWVAAVIVALFLIAGFIAIWLFEHSNDQTLADQAFVPLQAIFICFTAMLAVMAFQRCFWIGLTKRTILNEAVEMGWLLGRLGLSESDWRGYILKKRLTVFIAERPLTEPATSQVKAACFYFFKIMFGYSKLAFWAAAAQRRACFLREQVEPIIAEIEAAKPHEGDQDDRLTEAARQTLLDLQDREQALLRQVAEQAEKIVQSTGRNDDLAAQVQDLTGRLEIAATDKNTLEERLNELTPKLSELERKNAELDDYINRRVGGLNAEIQQKTDLLEEYGEYVGKGNTEKGKRAKFLSQRLTSNIQAQFSICKSGTRSNSLVLLVTRVNPEARAWAAIHRSLLPIGRPIFSSSALIWP